MVSMETKNCSACGAPVENYYQCSYCRSLFKPEVKSVKALEEQFTPWFGVSTATVNHFSTRTFSVTPEIYHGSR